MRQRLIMTKDKKVVPAITKLSATPAYTVDELRDKVGSFHEIVADNPRTGMIERFYLNQFLNWLENPEEFTGE